MPALGGEVERGHSVATHRVNVRPVPEERPDGLDAAFAGGREQPLLRSGSRVLRPKDGRECCRHREHEHSDGPHAATPPSVAASLVPSSGNTPSLSPNVSISGCPIFRMRLT